MKAVRASGLTYNEAVLAIEIFAAKKKVLASQQALGMDHGLRLTDEANKTNVAPPGVSDPEGVDELQLRLPLGDGDGEDESGDRDAKGGVQPIW